MVVSDNSLLTNTRKTFLNRKGGWQEVIKSNCAFLLRLMTDYWSKVMTDLRMVIAFTECTYYSSEFPVHFLLMQIRLTAVFKPVFPLDSN